MNQANTGEKKAIIAGCGIAGPALAMFLQQIGITPVIYERHSQGDDEAGFFLNMSPNGLDVLNSLGLEDEIRKLGETTNRVVFQNHAGKTLGENPEPTILLKRGLLTKALREAAAARGVPIEFEKQLTDVNITSRGTAVAQFKDGTEVEGDFLVGCDGIHSRTRRSAMPEAPPPEYLGVIDSGGFTRNESVPASDAVFRMTFGKEGFFGYQAVPSGEIYWFENFVQKNVPDEEHIRAIPQDEWRSRLLDIHKGDHEPITEIIRSTENGIGKWLNYEVPSLPAWQKGPVCLLGDAAHAMSPSAGQGASMALEDAVVLAKCLRDLEDAENAFASFERERRNRVETIARDARRNSDQKGPTNVFSRWVRDLVLPFLLKMGVNNARQIYAYRVEWENNNGVKKT